MKILWRLRINLGLSQKRYQLEIPQLVWEEFFEQFTEDNRERPITLQIVDQQLGSFNLLSGTPLHSVIYEPPDLSNDLVVAVSRQLQSREVTFAHTIDYPQAITIITDDDGLVLSCIVTDDNNAQTVIHFED
jgi:hypothetical protein